MVRLNRATIRRFTNRIENPFFKLVHAGGFVGGAAKVDTFGESINKHGNSSFAVLPGAVAAAWFPVPGAYPADMVSIAKYPPPVNSESYIFLCDTQCRAHVLKGSKPPIQVARPQYRGDIKAVSRGAGIDTHTSRGLVVADSGGGTCPVSYTHLTLPTIYSV